MLQVSLFAYPVSQDWICKDILFSSVFFSLSAFSDPYVRFKMPYLIHAHEALQLADNKVTQGLA